MFLIGGDITMITICGRIRKVYTAMATPYPASPMVNLFS